MKMPGLKNLSLRIILIIYVVLPLAASLALTVYLSLWIWESKVESQMKSDLETVAKAIQLPLSHALERDRQGGVEQALESAFSLDTVYSAYAYDLEGRQIASVGQEDPDPEKDKLSELVSTGEHTGEFGRVGERRVYSYFIPLTDSRDRASGLLQLTRRERDFRNYIGKIRLHAFALLGIGVMIMTALVLFGQYQALGRHFRLFINGMQRVAAGEKQHRIPTSGPKEIMSIAKSFNQMLDSIQSAEDEIKRNRQEQLALERQLRQTEKMAAIGQLAAGVAHELGTPLSTISGTAQRGLRHEDQKSLTAKSFGRIRNEVNRMEVIIRQLLDFSYRQELQCRRLLPIQVVKSAMAAVAKEAETRNVKVTTTGDENATRFWADPIRMEQALVNLLRNAIQAADNIEVQIGWREENGQMIIAVDDSGPGIPEDVRPRLFEPFFTTKNVGAGTGLGLAVVHGIVKEHGGTVHASKSNLGGARLEMRIPVSSELI